MRKLLQQVPHREDFSRSLSVKCKETSATTSFLQKKRFSLILNFASTKRISLSFLFFCVFPASFLSFCLSVCLSSPLIIIFPFPRFLNFLLYFYTDFSLYSVSLNLLIYILFKKVCALFCFIYNIFDPIKAR